MKVISIGTDRKIFEADSQVRARAVEYATLFDELHIIVFSKYGFTRRPAGNKRFEKIGDNLYLYPTRSFFKIFYIKDAYKVAKRIIKERKLTKEDAVVTVQDPFETGLVGNRIKNRFGLKLHVQVHTDVFNPYFYKQSVINGLRVSMAKKVLPNADAVRTVSERVKQSLEKAVKLKSPASILPIFVDIEKYDNAEIKSDLKQRYPQFNFIILMASRLTKEKNIPLALEIIKRLLPAYSKLGLVIVGDGPEKNTIKQKAKELNIQNNVVFEDWTNDMVSYYKTANLFLLTSWFEGYSMTIIEAAASHCPIVSTDVGVASEVLHDGDTSSVCPVGDEQCLQSIIRNLIGDNALREQMVHEVFERLSRVVVMNKMEYLTRYKNDIIRTLNNE